MSAVDFAAFVDKLADIAGEAVLPFFRTALAVDNKKMKSAFDPVTDADRAAETAMRAAIGKQFPAHGIVGEEFDDVIASAPYTWILDPIDGTKSFIAGIPAWGTLIGLLKDGEPVYGMMSQPFIGERFTGDGALSRYRGPNGLRKLMTRQCAQLSDAILFTTSPQLFGSAEREKFDRVERGVRLSRYGGDCYAYCMVAAGHIDLVIEAGLDSYDIVPLIPIIEGAGGIVTNWQGEPAYDGGQVIAAGDKRAHQAALELLNK